MKGDRELCTAAVAQNGLALEHCKAELKSDEALVIAHVQWARTVRHANDTKIWEV